MLKEGTGFSRVIICCGRVDLRKGIPGLSAYVRLNYGLDAAEKGTLSDQEIAKESVEIAS